MLARPTAWNRGLHFWTFEQKVSVLASTACSPQVQPFGSAPARSASPTRGGRAPSPLRAPSPGPPAGQGMRAPPSPPQAPQGLAQGLQGPPREGRRSPAPGSRAQYPAQCAFPVTLLSHACKLLQCLLLVQGTEYEAGAFYGKPVCS